MKFSTRQDIEAPAEYVFDRISDFDGFERQAMRRGLELHRKVADQPRGVGAAWVMQIPFRGKLRELNAEISEYDRADMLAVQAVSGGLNLELNVELVPLSRHRTRLAVGLDLRPKTISARILVQSIKFAKVTLQKRFEKRVKKFCRQMSDDFQGAPMR